MPKIANKTARKFVQVKAEFQGSNTEGKLIRGAYVVLSYGYYPIYVYKDGKWYENTNRYSVSTAKQMSQLRPTSDTTLKSTDELKQMYSLF